MGGEHFEEVRPRSDAKRRRHAFGVLRSVTSKSRDILRRTVDADTDTEVGSFTMSYVCSHCGLFPIADFIGWVTEVHGERRVRGHDNVTFSMRRVEDRHRY